MTSRATAPRRSSKAAADGRTCRRGHRRHTRRGGRSAGTRPAGKPPRPTCRGCWSGARGASTGCRFASANWIGATGSRRRCWATSAEEAMREAGRCPRLRPGLQPLRRGLPQHRPDDLRDDAGARRTAGSGGVGGVVVANGSTPLVVARRLQIAVLTDFCNECGTCVTACPTDGRPFAEETAALPRPGGFRGFAALQRLHALRRGVMEARFDGETHRSPRWAARSKSRGPRFRAVVDRDTFAVIEATPPAPPTAKRFSLEPAAVMATLLAGVTGSLPHIPTAAIGCSPIVHPGHEE